MHARQKPHLPICACAIGDLELIKKQTNKLRFSATGVYLIRPGLRNNEFTYHDLNRRGPGPERAAGRAQKLGGWI